MTRERDRAGAPTRWQCFRHGFQAVGPLALAGGLGLGILVMAALQQVFVGGAWTRIPMRYWLRHATDVGPAVSWMVQDLRRHPPEQPLVVLLGGSSAREAWPGNEAMAAAIRAAGGPRVLPLSLATHAQSLAQSLAIIDNLPPGRACILLGVHKNRFLAGPVATRQQVLGRGLLLDSPRLARLDEELGGTRRLPLGIVPGVLTYLASYPFFHYPELRKGHLVTPEVNWHIADLDPVEPLPAKLEDLRQLRLDLPKAMEENFGYNCSVLRDLVRLCRERGLSLCLVELPENRAITGTEFRRYDELVAGVYRELDRTDHIPYFSFNDELGMRNDEFYDLYHLTPDGRRRWGRKLAETIVPALAKAFSGSGGS